MTISTSSKRSRSSKTTGIVGCGDLQVEAGCVDGDLVAAAPEEARGRRGAAATRQRCRRSPSGGPRSRPRRCPAGRSGSRAARGRSRRPRWRRSGPRATAGGARTARFKLGRSVRRRYDRPCLGGKDQTNRSGISARGFRARDRRHARVFGGAEPRVDGAPAADSDREESAAGPGFDVRRSRSRGASARRSGACARRATSGAATTARSSRPRTSCSRSSSSRT